MRRSLVGLGYAALGALALVVSACGATVSASPYYYGGYGGAYYRPGYYSYGGAPYYYGPGYGGYGYGYGRGYGYGYRGYGHPGYYGGGPGVSVRPATPVYVAPAAPHHMAPAIPVTPRAVAVPVH